MVGHGTNCRSPVSQFRDKAMIDPSTLCDNDVGRRVYVETAPSVEEVGRLGAWVRDTIVVFLPMAGGRMRPVEVAPSQVRWFEDKAARAS